ncbi:hypothetical protein CYMTET_43908 [Cymbomonas tetramitiformis]|uniref:Uncharacterized protein n=1 Tax=Cymbomonas tetramitiformis TaxID=36881 RepID=A0AAE0C2I3_9CHLO|nr:hypothetical protein CYMTET_43908 [Cymbomonas tetramitiformis]
MNSNHSSTPPTAPTSEAVSPLVMMQNALTGLPADPNQMATEWAPHSAGNPFPPPAVTYSPHGFPMVTESTPRAGWPLMQPFPATMGPPASFHPSTFVNSDWAWAGQNPNQPTWSTGGAYGQHPQLHSQYYPPSMPYHTPAAYDPSTADRWTSPGRLAIEATSPSLLPTEHQRLWWIQMEKQWQTSAAPSTALPSTSARPGNFPDQEDFSMQPDEEVRTRTDNLDEGGRPLLPLKPHTSSTPVDSTKAGVLEI